MKKLDRDEARLLAAVERGDWKRPTTAAKDMSRLQAVAQPTKIILFGSQARGDADDHSDVDLLVIKPHVADRYEEMVRLQRSLRGLLLPVDLLVVSEQEFEERANRPGTAERAAQREGHVLYAV
jgi:uncharacterized protein